MAHATTLRTTPVLLDTDMGNDIDDALALTMLHALQRRGECELIGISLSKDNPWAAPYTRLVNIRCGNAGVPVGRISAGPSPDEGNFIRQITQSCPAGTPLTDKAQYEESVPMLRRLLASQEDGSVVIITIGFFTNLARLLDSPADAISPLHGHTLLARKVKSVCSMAANFRPTPEQSSGPDSGNPEFNIRTDISAARHFITHCPRPIDFSGFEIGIELLFPSTRIEEILAVEPSNPVASAYAAYVALPHDRPCWDQTAVLQAVRPSEHYFDLSQPGHVHIDDQGHSIFQPKTNGPHRHLIFNARSHRDALEEIIRLSTEFPS